MMPQSQSPRFHLHQQQILLMQQQQEQQQQHRLQELQEQLRLEEIERQLRVQQISDRQPVPNHFTHQRQSSGPSLVELQAAQAHQQLRQRSPAFADSHNYPLLSQQNMQHMPQNIQVQQRLLSEMAQAEFLRDLQGVTAVEQEALRMEAMRKIMETERMEEKRRRRAAKIAHMVSLRSAQRGCLFNSDLFIVTVQRSDDPVGQRFHHANPSLPASYPRPLRR
jgi:DNA topoisomerase 2-associated protein PAT1